MGLDLFDDPGRVAQPRRRLWRGTSRALPEAVRGEGADVFRTRQSSLDGDRLRPVRAAQTWAQLMTTARDNLSKADTMVAAAIEAKIRTPVEADPSSTDSTP